jgi:hypothetical protein
MNKMRSKLTFPLMLGLFCLIICSCEQQSKKEVQPAKESHEGLGSGHGMDMGQHEMAMSKTEKQVIVPDEVKQKWTTVSISVKDKISGESTNYEVKPDSEFEIPQTNLKIKIGAFLPDFTMDTGLITSASAEPNNPALQVTISESETEKYQGWLFAKFADVHAFEHEKYSITLLDNFNNSGAVDNI